MTRKIGLEQTMEQEMRLSHELSMKLMVSGQAILEIESRYMHCLTRSMQERVRKASRLLRELADECMTDMTRKRMLDWEKETYVPPFERVKEQWEIEAEKPENCAKWREHVRRMCKWGFLGAPVKR